MGAWGTGILSDDTVRDVIDGYFDLFNRGGTAELTRKKLLKDFRETLGDSDEGPLVWVGIAKAQWECGHLEPLVLERIRQIVSDGEGLDRWAEQGQTILQRRKSALIQFLAKLESTNPRPRKPRKATKRRPIFQPGDCLAVRLKDGEWGAILVLRGPGESEDPYVETYGLNLAVTLKYKGAEPPSLQVFAKREWLRQTHHSWQGDLDLCYLTSRRYRSVKDRFVLVGDISILDTDPTATKTYSSWANMTSSMYLQDRWDRGIRD
jgi:hypothetical protein